MNKKFFVALGLIAFTSAFMAQAMAEPTIYTDGIGRLHFLGKDPGSARRLDPAEANKYANPAQMEFTNTIFKGGETTETVTTQTVSDNSEVTSTSETKVSTKRENKSKGAFTFNKGSMDASDPYTFGNTNLTTPAPTVQSTSNAKKIYTDELGREHFFGKTNK